MEVGEGEAWVRMPASSSHPRSVCAMVLLVLLRLLVRLLASYLPL